MFGVKKTEIWFRVAIGFIELGIRFACRVRGYKSCCRIVEFQVEQASSANCAAAVNVEMLSVPALHHGTLHLKLFSHES